MHSGERKAGEFRDYMINCAVQSVVFGSTEISSSFLSCEAKTCQALGLPVSLLAGLCLFQKNNVQTWLSVLISLIQEVSFKGSESK